MGLALTTKGKALMQEAEATALESDLSAASALSPGEINTLIGLLQKIYLAPT